MSKAQHTPGPWTVHQDERQGTGTTAFEQYAEGNNGLQFDLIVVDSAHRKIATIPAAHLSGYSKVFAHKNSRLIAAAPDLLEALEHCLMEHGGYTIRGETERIARAAIAKAKGQ